MKNGGEKCAVILSCAEKGFGAISVYQRGLGSAIEASGSACGAETSAQAKAVARHHCEYQLAKQLSIPLPSFEDTSPALVRSLLAKGCHGLGNCQCSTRYEWAD
jgi:hypothetical protein